MSYRAFSFVLLLLIAALAVSCEDQDERIKKELESNLSKMGWETNELSSVEKLIVIPRNGCSACIGLADQYFKQKYTDLTNLFIFTKLNTLKTLEIRLGVEENMSLNVLIDKNHLFAVGALDTSYPLIVFLEEGSIRDYFFLNPDNYGRLRDLQFLN